MDSLIQTFSPVELMLHFAEKAPSKNSFRNFFLGKFTTFDDAGKEQVFERLSLSKGVKVDDFYLALDVVWNAAKDARRERRLKHKAAIAAAKHRQLCRVAVYSYHASA